MFPITPPGSATGRSDPVAVSPGAAFFAPPPPDFNGDYSGANRYD